jgi:hypothetical protein
MRSKVVTRPSKTVIDFNGSTTGLEAWCVMGFFLAPEVYSFIIYIYIYLFLETKRGITPGSKTGAHVPGSELRYFTLPLVALP